MARRKHRKRSKRQTLQLSVHDRPTLSPSAPPVAVSIAPDPEDLFFEERAPEPAVHGEDVEAPAKIFALPTTRASRSRFLPMVKIVVTACALLIFAGGFRSAIARSHRADPSKSNPDQNAHAAATSPPNPVNMADLERAAETPATYATLDSDPTAAAELTKKSQAKLEIGAVKASIEFGEDAVRLDPANAQAWLVLGAAYQQRGDIKNAWRCYHACVDQGKEAGHETARAECGLMLQPRAE